jgi:hypothetical protein
MDTKATGKAIAWAAAGAIAATALTGVAFAGANTTPSADGNGRSVAEADDQRPERGRMHGHGDELGHRVLHGDLVVENEDGDAVNVAVQRGEVTAVSSDSLTVKSSDGFTKTWTLTSDTKVHEGRDAAEIADIEVGDNVRVGSGDSGDTDTAARVGIRPADAPEGPAGAGFGRPGDDSTADAA